MTAPVEMKIPVDGQIQEHLLKGDGSEDPNNSDQPMDDQTNEAFGADDTKQTNKIHFSRVRIVRILLYVPYAVGILWTCLHPIVSVITGEAKCRGWYLDEHSIETRFTAGKNPASTPSHLKDLDSVQPLRTGTTNSEQNNHKYSLCDFLPREGDPGFNNRNLVCHQHGVHFDMAMIMPLSNAIDAIEEAVVLVIPRPSVETEDWKSSDFHKAVVRSIVHLADPIETPWLAKAVLVVTPSMDNNDNSRTSGNNSNVLEDTVSAFLDAYSGEQILSRDYQRRRNPSDEERIPQLPLRLSGSILRNLVVLEVNRDDDSPSTSIGANNNNKSRKNNPSKPPNIDLSILPQGRRGVLPNADLVFLVGKLLEKTVAFRMAATKTFLAHPFTKESKIAGIWIEKWLEIWKPTANYRRLAKTWAQGMADVGLFARTMAIGPFPPHAPALERGIDSLTIRVSFGGTFGRDPAVELVQHTEYVIRALANLHERLHHSFTLYLLPTPKTFVSHIEYLLPNILILLPLAVRIFGILLPSMTRGLDMTAVGGILLVVFVVLVAMAVPPHSSSQSFMTSWLVVLYTGVVVFWVQEILLRDHNDSSGSDKNDEHHRRALQTTRTVLTLQFVACAIAVYFLIPIAFAHISLAYFPSVMWTPLLAFPDYLSLKQQTTNSDPRGICGRPQKLISIVCLCLLGVATAPPVYLVPRVLSSYTAFVRYVYVPLHVLFGLLIASVIAS